MKADLIDEDVPCEFEPETKKLSCVNITVYGHALNHNDISKCKGNIKTSEHESFLKQLRVSAEHKSETMRHQSYKLSFIAKSKSKADKLKLSKVQFEKFSRVQSKCESKINLLKPNLLTIKPDFVKPKSRSNSKPRSRKSHIKSKRSQTLFKRDRTKKKLRVSVPARERDDKISSFIHTPYFKDYQEDSEDDES